LSHLLHIDSSISGDSSVTRRLTARAAAAWRAANPEGTVTYRDLGANPVPHLAAGVGNLLLTPPDQRTPLQAQTWERYLELAGELRDADTVLLGLPLYNYGPPSTVKAWADHIVVPDVTLDAATFEGLLGGKGVTFLAIVARGGGYSEGSPKFGWEHATGWLTHLLSMTGLEPRFIAAELTLAAANPAMAELIPLAEASLASAEAEIDALFSPAAV
jgi:FMN-dependent NADH-azoreductase